MEYKFRGFDATGQKGWVYGDLVHNQKVTRTGLEPRVMVGGYEVVPESVGLFTGTQDFDGKDLYEGDICRIYLYGRRMTAYIFYNEQECQFMFSSKHTTCPLYWISCCSKKGTLFENKELLK